MQKLTRRQSEILETIRRYQQETGYPPTRSEIAAEMGYRSANAAEEHLRTLARKGVLEMIPGASRGIRLLDQEPVDAGLPVIGQVAAGSPILAEECIDEHIRVPDDLFHPRADYLLTVRGLSMIEAGIMEGDLLAVHKTDQARDGDIVVARLEDEVTVKRLQRGRSTHRLTLHPENADFTPIHVDLRRQAFRIEGISVGVIRRSI
ncbi:MAG: transcriptional repressor LexA [Pseudomonadota bacterium]